MEIEPTWETRRAWQMRPDRRPVMCQSWRNLAFFHWALDPEFIAQKLPPGLHVDTFDGRAWIGLVPFEMRNIRPRGLCSVPYISNFLELNVRTYVFDEQGRPGVWFFSLAANRAVAVWAARTFFSLPYFWSQMSETIREDWIDYRCLRKMEASRGTFAFRYRREGEFAEAPEASFEFFLVERYLLFTLDRRQRIRCGQVHHAPYRIAPLEFEICDPRYLEMDGFKIEGPPAVAHFSPGVDVDVFGLTD